MDTFDPTRLAHLIELSGLDDQEIDVLAGLARGHTGKLKRGERDDPAASTIVKLARTFGTTAEHLVDGEGPRPTADTVAAAIRRAKRRAGHGASLRRAAASGKTARPDSKTGSHRSMRSAGTATGRA